jgi:hypothetical protein
MAKNQYTGSSLSGDNVMPLSMSAWLGNCSDVFEVFLFFVSARHSSCTFVTKASGWISLKQQIPTPCSRYRRQILNNASNLRQSQYVSR